MVLARNGFIEKAHAYRGEVRFLMLKFTRDLTDADDLTAETYARLAAVYGLDHLPAVVVREFVLTTATHVAIDHGRRKRPPVDFVGDTPEDLRRFAPSAEDEAVRDETANRLRCAIEALSPSRRRLIELAIERGMDLDELCGHTHGNKNTVKRTLYDAWAILKQAIHNDGE